MKKSLLLGLAIFGLAGTASLQAQCFYDSNGNIVDLSGQPCNNVILTAVPFLRITPDARSGAMGDVGIAVSPDANSMHFNASKLAFAQNDAAISATYTPWLRSLGLNDVYLAYVSGYKRLNDLQALGFGLRYFSLGSIQFTDPNGEILNTGKPNEFEVSAAYSRKLSENFSAGVTAKFIYSNLAQGKQVEGEIIGAGTAGAADLSFTYDAPVKLGNTDADLTLGAVVSNIGSKITYTRSINKDFIPTNLGLGGALKLNFDDYNSLTFATDINKLLVPTPCPLDDIEACDSSPEDGVRDYLQQSSISGIFSSFGDAPGGFAEEMQELMFSFGAEYWYDNQFAVRAGYYTEHKQKGARRYLTIGLGLRYNIFGLNFSYLVPTTNQRNPLDNTLRFSLLFDFAGGEEVE